MKKILAMVMALCMISAVGVMSVSAAEDGINKSGGSDTTKVELTAEAATFKVTVPTVLPFSVDADGNVSVSTSAKISNLSNGPVQVTNVTAKTLDAWKLVENGTDFQAVKVNSPQFTMTLNGDNFAAGTTSALTLGDAWTPINGNADFALTYSGDFAEQSDIIDGENIANVIFTVSWYTV
jgi:uncharacterized protein (DUF736 family)